MPIWHQSIDIKTILPAKVKNKSIKYPCCVAFLSLAVSVWPGIRLGESIKCTGEDVFENSIEIFPLQWPRISDQKRIVHRLVKPAAACTWAFPVVTPPLWNSQPEEVRRLPRFCHSAECEKEKCSGGHYCKGNRIIIWWKNPGGCFHKGTKLLLLHCFLPLLSAFCVAYGMPCIWQLSFCIVFWICNLSLITLCDGLFLKKCFVTHLESQWERRAIY